MLNICCFKWHRNGDRTLPSQDIVDYGKDGVNHVNILYRMLKRHMKIPFTFICITDDKNDLDKGIEYFPLWKELEQFGGCYRRLKIFSSEMEYAIGGRIAVLDIDTVIVDDVTSLFSMTDELVLYKHPEHICNGGFWLFDAGKRNDIWTNFNIELMPEVRKSGCIGTDQAWLQYYLKKELSEGLIKTIGNDDGVYDYRLSCANGLPKDAKIIMFPGRRDPSQPEVQAKSPWIKDFWN